MGPWARRAIAVFVLASAASVLAPSARCQSFAPPVNVSQSASGSYLPSLVRDRGGAAPGTLRLYWHDFTSAPNLGWCADAPAGVFGAAAPAPFNVTQSWSVRAASDAFGVTHVVWRDRTAGVDDVLHAFFDGVGWSSPENLSRSAVASRNPVLAIDPWDRPHVMWEEDTAGGVKYFVSHFESGAWTTPRDTGLAYSVADTLRIACDSAGTLHATWPQGGSVTEVLHAELPDGGAWSAAENVSLSPTSFSTEPSIAVDAADGLHVAWVEQDAGSGTTSEICVSTMPSGGSWSPRQEVTALRGDTWRPSIAVGSDDVPRIAFSAGPIANREVMFLAAPGASPVTVSLTPGVDSSFSSLVLDDTDTPWIAWQEGAVPTPEIFLAGPDVVPPSPILLLVAKDGDDALLTWTGGAAPFVVTRASAPQPTATWTELTPAGGIGASAWTDAGVIVDGVKLWCYSVD